MFAPNNPSGSGSGAESGQMSGTQGTTDATSQSGGTRLPDTSNSNWSSVTGKTNAVASGSGSGSGSAAAAAAAAGAGSGGDGARSRSSVSEGKRPSLGNSDIGQGGEAVQFDDGDEDEPGPSHKRKGSAGDEGMQRVQLACFYCRNKRIRCSGEKPICSACQKANIPCEWPSGRRKKRTRKEMEEAKRAEAAIQEQLAKQNQTQPQSSQSHNPAATGQGGTGQYAQATSQSPNQPMQGPPMILDQGQGQRQGSMAGIGSIPGLQQGMGQGGGSQGINPSALSGTGFINASASGSGGGMNFGTGLEAFNFESDENSYSADLSTFDPNDLWTFPSTSTFGSANQLPLNTNQSNTNNPQLGTNQNNQLSSNTGNNNSNTNSASLGGGNNNNNNNNNDFSQFMMNPTPISSNYIWPTGFTPETNLPGVFSSTESNPSEPIMAHFMNQSSPATDMRLISALENQAAFIQGNPGKDEDLELFYYRFSGSTAIQPGIHRISLKLQRRSNNGESPMTAAPQPEADEATQRQIPTPTRAPADLFDSTGMPRLHIWQPLFELFLNNMSQHFPSVSRQRMTERFETGTMSQFLANCICAVGARFASDAVDRQTQACAPFIAKAQELIIPLVHLPTTETTTGLIFLAWANFGQNSESGLWQYTGMAIRMAIDIGIHENSEVYESPAHVIRTRMLFWTLFVTDRIVAFATGRPASISEEIVEVPLPEDQDFFPDPARNTPGYPPENIEPVPFVYFVRLMIICGRISNVLNGRRGRARTLVNTAEPLAEQLAELQTRLVQFVAGLPESLRWSADNFKHQHNRGHGGCFLALHLWSHAVLALIYHPELLKSPSGIETPLNRSMNRNVKLSLASSRQICECMVFADLVAPNSYTSTPFLVQPLYVASMAIIHEMRAIQAAESTGNPTDMFLISMARQNLTALLSAVAKMEQFWAGTGYVATILEKPGSRAGRRTFISLPDTGLLKRFSTDKEDPRDLAPATDTSLRESIAKSERNNPSPYWLADLMAGYTVENMSFTPADSFDLERLLAGNFGGGSFGAIGGSMMAGMGPSQMQGQGQSQSQSQNQNQNQHQGQS